jgi:hypothetical protein
MGFHSVQARGVLARANQNTFFSSPVPCYGERAADLGSSMDWGGGSGQEWELAAALRRIVGGAAAGTKR